MWFVLMIQLVDGNKNVGGISVKVMSCQMGVCDRERERER